MKKGERFSLQGIDEKRFVVEAISVGKKDLTIKILDQILTPPELQIKVNLFQAYVNEKALDFILQKSTELGAHKITLFNSANVGNKLSADQFNKKQERWNKILMEAAKQSDRVRPPKLEFADDVQSSLSEYKKIILLDPQGSSVKEIVNRQSLIVNSLGLIVGPEGGFTPQEIDKFKSLPNCAPVSLGPILLRAETAALAGLVLISNLA